MISFITVPDPKVTGGLVSAKVENSANLTCNVSGDPNGTTITYQWKRAGTPLQGATSATYEVSSVAVSDAGVYTCEVTVRDSGGSTHVVSGTGSADVTLTVTSK